MEMHESEENATVLIVEDEKVNIDILVDLLKPGYHIKIAKSGNQALQAMANVPPPDLILLDIMMPDMDGYEVCRRLKSNPETCGIPIIFLTSKTRPEDVITGFRLGAVDYVTKPFQPEELIARVSTHVRLNKTISRLETALRKIKTLKRLLPICSVCNRIRDDKGHWNQIAEYISRHSETTFTHGICPVCAKRLYPNIKLNTPKP